MSEFGLNLQQKVSLTKRDCIPQESDLELVLPNFPSRDATSTILYPPTALPYFSQTARTIWQNFYVGIQSLSSGL